MKVKNLKGEEIERDIPKAGEYWKHFKGNVYRIVCKGKYNHTNVFAKELLKTIEVVGKEAEDYYVHDQWIVWYEREKVIYYRSLDDFMDVAPIHKYPDVKQEWRFEKVSSSDQ